LGPAILQRERPGGGRVSCKVARVRWSPCCELHCGGLPRAVGPLRELVCLICCPSLPSTGRGDYGGPLPTISGREVLYFRPREECVGGHCLLLEGELVQPPPDPVAGGGYGAASCHKKIWPDAEGGEGALPMGLGGVLCPSLWGTQPRLLPLGGGIHFRGDVRWDVQV